VIGGSAGIGLETGRRVRASASLLGDGLEARREELRATPPIGRVVGPEDVAALAIHLTTPP
jgi:hypothetical protein